MLRKKNAALRNAAPGMRPAAPGKVFLHLSDEDKRNRIEELCQEMGFSFAVIGTEDINRTVLELISGREVEAFRPGAGGNGSAVQAPPLYFLPELILFQGLSNGELEQFLASYHAAGIPPVMLKAAVTPYNLRWTIYELAEHLKEEHEAMTSGKS